MKYSPQDLDRLVNDDLDRCYPGTIIGPVCVQASQPCCQGTRRRSGQQPYASTHRRRHGVCLTLDHLEGSPS
jgi:hypothetical protein